MTFNNVAKNIIKDTISSAVFIDDKALENFKSKNYKFASDHSRTIDLFNDFKKNQCLLHSFKFTKKGWKDHKEFYLKNKDLLILDWQLIGEDHSYALKILEDAVWRKNLHFVCIYTNENPSSVKNELIRYYTGVVNDATIEEIRSIISDAEDLNEYWELDDEDINKIEFEEYIDNILNAKKIDLDTQIEEFFTKYNIVPEIEDKIKGIYPDDKKISFSKLKSSLYKNKKDFSNKTPEKLFVLSDSSFNTLYINHTIVKIFKKNEVQGDNLYEEFLGSFMQDQNKFLTLMGLEMRNRFRENSAFIGKDFTDLSEEAFFYHRVKNTDHSFIFNDYLIDILKDQVSSFIHEKELALSGVWDEYFASINGTKKIADFEHSRNSDNFHNEIFKLNYFYNRLNIYERKKNNLLRFGDVFHSIVKKTDKDGAEFEKEVYFICITPHCDCLRPSKINNQFWFVEGEKLASQQNALKKTDGRFMSFVKDDNDMIFVIDWTRNTGDYCIPLTMQISNNKFESILDAEYYSQKIKLKLIASLKENYAQRIANEATGYNYRVGIDFVKK